LSVITNALHAIGISRRNNGYIFINTLEVSIGIVGGKRGVEFLNETPRIDFSCDSICISERLHAGKFKNDR
jgi:hypothetical protein